MISDIWSPEGPWPTGGEPLTDLCPDACAFLRWGKERVCAIDTGSSTWPLEDLGQKLGILTQVTLDSFLVLFYMCMCESAGNVTEESCSQAARP